MSNEDQTTAIVAGETLIYQRGGQDYQLPVGTPAWYAWLQTATIFRVRSPFGTFTMRREQAGHKHRAWYWRAYRKRNAPPSLCGQGGGGDPGATERCGKVAIRTGRAEGELRGKAYAGWGSTP